MMREPTEDELPAQFDELVPLERVERDEYNVRNIKPPESLVESVKKTGFKSPLIVRENGGTYLVTDGWERYQAAMQIGLSHVPCEVYENTLRALREARRGSIQTPWTKHQERKHYVNFYDLCREEGYDHDGALKKTVNEQDVSRRALKRYIDVFNLPSPVLALLKEPENRTESEWERLARFNPNIKKSTSKLPVKAAAALSKHGEGVSTDRMIEIGVEVLGENGDIAKKIAIDACENPNKPISKIREKHLHNLGETQATLGVSSVVVDNEVKDTLKADSRNRRVPLKKVVKEALEEKSKRVKDKGWFGDEE